MLEIVDGLIFAALDIDLRNRVLRELVAGGGLVSLMVSQPSSRPSRMIWPASSVWKVPRSRCSPVSVLLLDQ